MWIKSSKCFLLEICSALYSTLCVSYRPTPAGPVRWWWRPRRDQHGTNIFLSWHPGPTSWAKVHGASFIGQTTIRTRQILLGFYPSVQITSQFMSHDWELLSLHGKSIAIRIFLEEAIENLARTMWLRIMRLYSVYAIFGIVTSSTM
jgi:hypothetical protein